MKLFTFLTAVTAVAALALAAPAAEAKASKNSQEFVKKVSISDMFEIESSKLALEKSQNDKVKQFAQQMIDDHTKSSNDLKATLASAKAQAAPAEALDEKHQAILDKLQAAPAEDFDKQYIDAQNNAHKEGVALFTKYSKKGDNKVLKGFATQTLPVLKQHKEHVEQLKSNS